TLKNAWTTSRQVNFFWVANFNLKFGVSSLDALFLEIKSFSLDKNWSIPYNKYRQKWRMKR
ncbi:hypothetical protein RK842_04185, partial [Streptococcus pneumoniae]|nr:hypothetical protein [Streptococcus pneumoniae]MDS2335995.1 hypothetical protein [Streptococcus pneumoniae]MDS2402952.1 hypothetical protein [Streptococcus pneumoniae]MDS2626336.1 hypothetical protein [Streptococcus pneumoniae]MDS3847461.1 hypothetical protein [Streptococcus pneumoniae]